jgi:hypothetical protein
MVQRFLSLFRSGHENPEVLDELSLAGEILEPAGPKRLVQLDLVFESFG